MKLSLTLPLLLLTFTAFAQEEPVQEAAQEKGDMVFGVTETETLPVYPGCEDKENNEERFNCLNFNIQMAVARAFVYPATAREEGRSGRVYMQFVIEKDGTITNRSVVRSSGHEDIDQAALEALNAIPQMVEPAYLKGEPVRIQYTVPVNARME